MNIITKTIIQNDPSVYATAILDESSKKYGVCIGFEEKTPSGCIRNRILLTSLGFYETTEVAIKEGENIIKLVKNML